MKFIILLKNKFAVFAVCLCIFACFMSINPQKALAADTYYIYGKYNANVSLSWYATPTNYPPVLGSFSGMGYSGYVVNGVHSFSLTGTIEYATYTKPVYIIWTDQRYWPYTDWLVKQLWDGESYTPTWYYGQSQNVYSQGSFISNVQALDGTYPVNGRGNDGYWYVRGSAAPTINLTTATNQTLSELSGNNILAVTGTVKDINNGDTLSVKYSVDGLSNHSGVLAATVTANGTDQPFNGYNIIINNTIPEGINILRVWVEDNYGGKSAEASINFTVNKSAIGSNGQAALRIITSENKAYKVDAVSGSYTDVTAGFLQNNSGAGKPFYVWSDTYAFNGTNSTFFDNGSTATYIGNHQLRVVTAEGKAFDVNTENGAYTDVTSTFLVNNFGSGKPFYHRSDEQYINGYGPYLFYDFGSTMAYIGNNKIRVVTSEGKAFDVDKDTGAYTDVTSAFITTSNFGSESGKPFYLRICTYTIGGEAKTFYDWGTTMAYIGNNTLRVVTSEGKAFNVNITDGSYTDVTSTFLVNNFGSGKPFYLRTCPVTINGTNYNFYDFGSTMGYTQSFNPDLAITSPQTQAAFDQISLTGTVSDSDNHSIMISAAIAGVNKTCTVSDTATPKPWILTWDIAADNIPAGSYSNIAVQANGGAGEMTNARYDGTINVFDPASNMTRKTVTNEYDDNGKLVNQRVVVNP